jgi:hypothetical protein
MHSFYQFRTSFSRIWIRKKIESCLLSERLTTNRLSHGMALRGAYTAIIRTIALWSIRLLRPSSPEGCHLINEKFLSLLSVCSCSWGQDWNQMSQATKWFRPLPDFLHTTITMSAVFLPLILFQWGLYRVLKKPQNPWLTWNLCFLDD